MVNYIEELNKILLIVKGVSMFKRIIFCGLLTILLMKNVFASSFSEESVYQYLFLEHFDADSKDYAIETTMLHQLGPDAISVFFKVISDDSTQDILVALAKNQAIQFGWKVDRGSYERDNIVSRALYGIGELSKDSIHMNSINDYVEKLLSNGSTQNHYFLITAGFATLAKDTSKIGIQRLMKIKNDLEQKKYSLKSLDKVLNKTPEQARKSLLKAVNDQLNFQDERSKGIRP